MWSMFELALRTECAMDDMSGSGASRPSRGNISPASFVPDPIAGWICPHCMTTPYHLRANGSFSRHAPSPEFVNQHFAVCSGLTYQYNTEWQESEGGHSNPHKGVHDQPHQLQPASIWPWERSPTQFPHQVPHEPLLPGMMLSNVQNWQGYPSSTVQPPPSLSPPKFHSAFQQPQSYDYNPQQIATTPSRTTTSIAESMAPRSIVSSSDDAHAAAELLATANLATSTSPLSEQETLVLPEDRHIITDYLFVLMQQLRRCHFKESDRKARGGKRKNLELGYGGLECCHCAEGTGARKFFWTNGDRLANSFSEISGHVMSCANCPDQIKAALRTLKLRHPEQMAQRTRGSQKVFFRRVWRRLHPNNEDSEVGVSYSSASRISGRAQIDEEKPQFAHHESTHNEMERVTSGAGESSFRVPLAIDTDIQWLSDMDCSIRRSVEVFCASAADVTLIREVAGNYPIKKNQVGLRCIYCASTTEGATGSAVMYPLSINVVYDKVREFHRSHLKQCPNLPPKERNKLSRQENSTKSLSSISRCHYLEAAKFLGMYDTVDGIFLQTSTFQESTAPISFGVAQPLPQHCQEEGERVFAARLGNKAESSQQQPRDDGTAKSLSRQVSDSRKRKSRSLSSKTTEIGDPVSKKPPTKSETKQPS